MILLLLISLFLPLQVYSIDALLYWNLTCLGPAQGIRFEFNCNEKLPETAQKLGQEMCENIKDIADSIDQGEIIQQFVKTSANSRYLLSKVFRIVYELNDKEQELRGSFKQGYVTDRSHPSCTLIYYVYKDFNVFEDRLVEIFNPFSCGETETKISVLTKLVMDLVEKPSQIREENSDNET